MAVQSKIIHKEKKKLQSVICYAVRAWSLSMKTVTEHLTFFTKTRSGTDSLLEHTQKTEA